MSEVVESLELLELFRTMDEHLDYPGCVLRN